jgi:hypothetical protein
MENEQRGQTQIQYIARIENELHAATEYNRRLSHTLQGQYRLTIAASLAGAVSNDAAGQGARSPRGTHNSNSQASLVSTTTASASRSPRGAHTAGFHSQSQGRTLSPRLAQVMGNLRGGEPDPMHPSGDTVRVMCNSDVHAAVCVSGHPGLRCSHHFSRPRRCCWTLVIQSERSAVPQATGAPQGGQPTHCDWWWWWSHQSTCEKQTHTSRELGCGSRGRGREAKCIASGGGSFNVLLPFLLVCLYVY